MQIDICVALINARPLPRGTSPLTSAGKPAPSPFPCSKRSGQELVHPPAEAWQEFQSLAHVKVANFFAIASLCAYKSPPPPRRAGLSAKAEAETLGHVGQAGRTVGAPNPPSRRRNLPHDARKHLGGANPAGSAGERALPAQRQREADPQLPPNSLTSPQSPEPFVLARQVCVAGQGPRP